METISAGVGLFEVTWRQWMRRAQSQLEDTGMFGLCCVQSLENGCQNIPLFVFAVFLLNEKAYKIHQFEYECQYQIKDLEKIFYSFEK